MNEIFVTGMGVVSSLGLNVKQNLVALKSGISGIKKTRHLKSKFSKLIPFGEVNCSNVQLKKKLNLDINITYSRTELLAIKAVNEAIKDSKMTAKELSDPLTALVSASTTGGMCHPDELYNDATSNSSSDYLDTYSCGAHTSVLAKVFKISGFTSTINTACSSSANAIMLGARLIKSGRANRVIVGGVDSLSKFTVNGFNSLGILSKNTCQPFSSKRDGLSLGEGAAYLVLESTTNAQPKIKLAKIIGYGNTNDAFHASAISENATGPTSAMLEALKMAGLKAADIDYINAHGTGTENNDRTELKAFSNIFNKIPAFSSTKYYTGHTLGAAGAIETVFSILSIINNEIYDKIEQANELQKTDSLSCKSLKNKIIINNVLTNSFGFAGNCTSLLLQKI